MKILIKVPEKIVRIAISRSSEKAHYVSLVGTNLKEVNRFVNEVINKLNIPNVIAGRKTSIVLRDSVGGVNGKSLSLACYHIAPEELKNILLSKLK